MKVLNDMALTGVDAFHFQPELFDNRVSRDMRYPNVDRPFDFADIVDPCNRTLGVDRCLITGFGDIVRVAILFQRDPIYRRLMCEYFQRKALGVAHMTLLGAGEERLSLQVFGRFRTPAVLHRTPGLRIPWLVNIAFVDFEQGALGRFLSCADRGKKFGVHVQDLTIAVRAL